MKTLRRIIAVILLVLCILVVGYLVYTGSQLTDTTTEVYYVPKT